jgi:phage baseplate assembly protein W
MDIAYPFRINSRARTETANYEDHIRHLIKQALFTMPGERVNRPDFGSELMQLTFNNLGDEVTSTIQFLVQGSIQQHLGDLIQLEAVEIQSFDSRLQVIINYIIKSSSDRRTTSFSYEV